MKTVDRQIALKIIRDRAKYELGKHDEMIDGLEEAYWLIADLPYEEKNTGRWELASDVDEGDRFWCSCCKDKGGTWGGPTPPPFEYCPHCGAKMEGSNDEQHDT